MNESQDWRGICMRLQTENQILRAQKEEAQERQISLRKQLQIMASAHEEENSNDAWKIEVDRLRQEVVSLLGEKEQMDLLNRTYLEKIDDLKYHNGQLKTLNEKMSQLHNREIEMIKKQSTSSESLRTLEEREKAAVREKELISQQLQEVAKIAQEMEQYYMGEIRKKNEIIKQKDQEIGRLHNEVQGKTQRFHHHDLVRQVNQHWQRQIIGLQQVHKSEIADLQKKINFLQKREEEDIHSKPSFGALSVASDMIQSKMVQSNSSLQNHRATPATIARQNQTRRNISGVKTPSKYGRRVALRQNNN